MNAAYCNGDLKPSNVILAKDGAAIVRLRAAKPVKGFCNGFAQAQSAAIAAWTQR